MNAYKRICPKCHKEVFHSSDRACRQSDKAGKPCKECGYEATRAKCRSSEFREAHSKRISEVWATEGSVFQTPEYKKLLSEAQLARDPNSYESASFAIKEAWRREKENPTGRIDRIVDANRRPDTRLKRSESLRKMYQEHPEKRIAVSERAKSFMKDPDFKMRCTVKMIAAARRTGGTSRHERQLAEILLKQGFLHKKEFGRWCVDFYHPEKDVIVEFYGDWWHCHPRILERIERDYGGIHPNCQKTPAQIIQEDEERVTDLTTNHAKQVIILWQNDVVVSGRVDQNRVGLLLSSFFSS